MNKKIYVPDNQRITVPDKGNEEQQAQEKLIIYQLLQNRAEELKQQISLLQQRFLELETTKQTLQDFKKLRQKNEILTTMGSGVYTPCKALDTNKLLVNIGADVMIKKTTPETIEIIETKKKEIEKILKRIENEMVAVAKNMNDIALEFEELAKK